MNFQAIFYWIYWKLVEAWVQFSMVMRLIGDHSSHKLRTFKVNDLTGKVAIITGGSSGIGFHASKRLAEHGAHVIIACRTVKKGEEAAETIKKEIGKDAHLTVLHLDLCDFSSIPKFVKEFNQLGLPLHILINNAGVMGVPYNQVEGKFEEQFGVNHLAHFLLTDLLLDKLKASAPARIVHVSSDAHYFGSFDWDDLNWEKGYGRFLSYGRSKLANVVFSNELAERLKGTGVTSTACHPGAIASDLYRVLGPLARKIVQAALLTPYQGSDSLVYLAASPEVEGATGKFYMGVEEAVPNPLATNAEVKERLWRASERFVQSYKK